VAFETGVPALRSGMKNAAARPGHRLDYCAAYPHLNDDAFVRANLQRWLS